MNTHAANDDDFGGNGNNASRDDFDIYPTSNGGLVFFCLF